jgi:hypothetical protein
MRRFLLPRGSAQARIGTDALEGIRASFAGVGLPIDDLTDEEIGAGVLGMQDAIRNSGVSEAQASTALASLAQLGADATRHARQASTGSAVVP